MSNVLPKSSNMRKKATKFQLLTKLSLTLLPTYKDEGCREYRISKQVRLSSEKLSENNDLLCISEPYKLPRIAITHATVFKMVDIIGSVDCVDALPRVIATLFE